MENDEIKKISTLDYNKVFISNFFFVRQYLILLIQREDAYFDMYSLRKKEVELLKTFNKVFNTINFMFKSNNKGFFSNLFSSKADKKNRMNQIMQNYQNVLKCTLCNNNSRFSLNYSLETSPLFIVIFFLCFYHSKIMLFFL